MTPLDARLLSAHDRGDVAALVGLYTEAADQSQSDDAAGFYLTHAMVFALDLGLDVARDLRARLVDMGREHPE